MANMRPSLRNRQRAAGPRSLQEAFFHLVNSLPRRARVVTLIAAIAAVALLGLWATLPDSTKERILDAQSTGVVNRTGTTSSISVREIGGPIGHNAQSQSDSRDAPTKETPTGVEAKPIGDRDISKVITLPHSEEQSTIRDDGLVLDLTDNTGSILTIKQADSYFESISPVGLGTTTRRTGGIEVRRGAGNIIISWADITTVDVVRDDIAMICKIKLRNGTTVSAACSSDLKIGGSADLGFYEVTLGELKSLRVVNPGF